MSIVEIEQDFGIHKTSYIDRSVEDYEFKEFRCQDYANATNLTQYTIQVDNKTDMFDIANACIAVRFRILENDTPKEFTGNERITLCNGGYHLFERVKLMFDQSVIGDVSNRPGQLHLLSSLVDFDYPYSKTVASHEWLYKETGDGGNEWQIATLEPDTTSDDPANTQGLGPRVIALKEGKALSDGFTDVTAGDFEVVSVLTADSVLTENSDTYNRGFKLMTDRTLNSRYTTLLLPLRRMFGYLKHAPKAMQNVIIRLDLWKNTNYKQILHSADDADNALIQINAVSLMVPVIKPSLSITAKLMDELALAKSSEVVYREYEIVHVQQIASPGNVASSSHYFEVNALKWPPMNVYITLQRHDQGTDEEENFGVFDHMNLINLYIEMNRERFPKQENYRPQYNQTNPDCNWTREYFALVSRKIDLGDESSMISYDDFRNIYPIYKFDTSKRARHALESLSAHSIQVSLTVESPDTTTNPPTAIPAFDVIVMVEYEKKAKIENLTNDKKFRILPL